MIYHIQKLIICFFILSFLISCSTNQDGQSLQETATEEDIVSSNAEASESDQQANESSDIEVSAQSYESPELLSEKLKRELIEVGDRVFFDYDQSSFKPEGEQTLDRQAKFLIKNQDLTILIQGHCDERGTREYNLALGERRAANVKNYLVSLGVSAERISIISYGKERPSVIGHNEESWTQNRTAITIINKD